MDLQDSCSSYLQELDWTTTASFQIFPNSLFIKYSEIWRYIFSETESVAKYSSYFVGFEVLPVAVIKSDTFWDTKRFIPLKVSRYFGEIYYLHLQGHKISWAKNNCESKWQALLILRPWRWRPYVPQKCQLSFNRLHGVISQKTIRFFLFCCSSNYSKHDKVTWTYR
jgi:hypothetical protein